tara:strand:+ start:340 stop:507 length:168 start_codon:yes stop_codon:yes gene_type:complete
MENLILILIILIFIIVLLILRRIERHLTLHGQSLWLIMEHLKTQIKKPKKNVSKK